MVVGARFFQSFRVHQHKINTMVHFKCDHSLYYKAGANRRPLLNPQQLASEMTTVESNANNANEVFVPPGRNNRGITLPLHGKQHVLNAVY